MNTDENGHVQPPWRNECRRLQINMDADSNLSVLIVHNDYRK